MPKIGDQALEELAAIDNADELCRRLLASSCGWGSSTRHTEAIELLANVHATSELPASFLALMVCTCRRWDRVTAKLIAALEDAAMLDEAGLDELAESFLAHEQVISYPVAWVSPEWLEVDIDDGTGHIRTVNEDTLAQHCVWVEPPLRRWAAHRALRSHPARLDELLRTAELLEPRHRDALIRGLLDAADALDQPSRRALIDRGLNTGQASARRAALDRLCELDGAETALRKARTDTNATVRGWRPPAPQLVQSTLL